jgi:hypothetical protein
VVPTAGRLDTSAGGRQSAVASAAAVREHLRRVTERTPDTKGEAMIGDPPRYRHTQIGYLTILGLVGASLSQLGAAAHDIRAGRRRVWSYLPASLVFLASMAMSSSLTAEVTDDTVSAWFTLGLFRRTIRLADVQEATVVTIPWYAGWGVRYSRSGLLYCVWGRHAARLTLAGGRTFTIGSDEPGLLLAAIEEARAIPV